MGRNGKISAPWDGWRASPRGIYINRRKQKLLVSLLRPVARERVLYVCRHNGASVNFLRKEGCAVTLFVFGDPYSRGENGRDGRRPGLLSGDPEDLPFSDDEFDVVVLEACLEFARDPEGAVSEAVRVCRGRVFIAVSNWISLHRMPVIPTEGPSRGGRGEARFFSAGEIFGVIRRVLPEARVRWGSVLFFPYPWYIAWSDVEDRIPTARNPFGFYLGFVFPVVFSLRSLQEALPSGIVKDFERETNLRTARKIRGR